MTKPKYLSKPGWATIRIALLIAILPFATGCVTGRINSRMNNWMGHSYSEVVMAWGPPQSVVPDGNGGVIATWIKTRQTVTEPGQAVSTTGGLPVLTPSGISQQTTTTYTPPTIQTSTSTRSFQIDKDGRIISWSWHGL